MPAETRLAAPETQPTEADAPAVESQPASRSVPTAGRSPIVTAWPEPEPIEVLRGKPLYQFNEREVDVYLRYLARAEPDPVKRLLHLARKNIGQPYELYLLGEFPYETHDPDPMYCLAKSDCVTFSEHTYAMAFARDWASFFRILQRLRYKDGRVGMLTRNHETVCDWDRNNAWLFMDATRTLGQGKQWVAMSVFWRPSRFFSQFGIGQDLPDVRLTDAYIPRRNIGKVLAELRDGDFVNVIRGDGPNQWCGHVGIIGHGPGGEVHFIHSSRPAVREQPLVEYLAGHRSVLGLKILRLKSHPQRVVEEAMRGD